MIFRNDDVSPATSFHFLMVIYKMIEKYRPDAEIWSCMNMFSRSNNIGSVYPDLPLKTKQLKYFYNVDQIWSGNTAGLKKVVSHGLIHADHTYLDYGAKKMSIITSCKLLKTDIFVPPFNKYDEEMDDICKKIGVRMVKPSDGWRSLETEDFDPTHELWFFHSWRFTLSEFDAKLKGVLQSV